MTIDMNRLLACAVLALPGAGLAQDISGAATLGYAKSSIPNFAGGDEDTFTLDAAGDVDFRNGWNLGLDGSFAHINPDDSGDANAVDLGLKLQYRNYGGAIFGGYVDYFDIDNNGLLGLDADATSYGFTAGYGNALFQAEANIGWTDASVSGLGSTSDWMDYGVNVAYTPTAMTKIAGHWQLSDLDTRFGGTNFSSYGIAASHDFGSGFLGFGGITRVDFDAANVDATSFGFGLGYDLRQVSGLPALVSLELARTNVDTGFGDADADTVRLGLTLPFGNRASSAPLNSLADSIMTPRHNAISTLVDNAY